MIKEESWLKPEVAAAKTTSKVSQRMNKILIIAPAWIGDMVMAQTLFKLIQFSNPQAIIDVLAPSWTLPLTERMPEVSEGILFPFGHGELAITKRYQFAKQLRNRKYDQVIVLPGSYKSALTALWARIPKRTGWLGEWRIGVLNDVRKLDQKKLPLMVQQFAALGLDSSAKLGTLEPFYPQLRIECGKRQQTLEKWQLELVKPIIALCPGAEYGPAKRWPAKYFAEIANSLLQKDWQVWIFGSNKDKSLAEEIDDLTQNRCVDLTGKTSLLEAVDLLSVANGVIANDSGLMHIAAALQRPLVVIYGSSTPNFTPPLSESVSIVQLGLSCSPCFKRTCPLSHFDCMNKITPNQVLSTLNNLIKS